MITLLLPAIGASETQDQWPTHSMELPTLNGSSRIRSSSTKRKEKENNKDNSRNEWE